VLEFGGKKEKEIWFIWVVQLLRDHHQFIADIESRLGFLLRLRFRFRFWFFLVCDCVFARLRLGWCDFRKRFCLFYCSFVLSLSAIVCHSNFHWSVPLLFPILVNIFVSGLGLCACFVGVGVVCLKVVVPFMFVDPVCVLSNILCHIKCVCGPCLQFFFFYLPDITCLKIGV